MWPFWAGPEVVTLTGDHCIGGRREVEIRIDKNNLEWKRDEGKFNDSGADRIIPRSSTWLQLWKKKVRMRDQSSKTIESSRAGEAVSGCRFSFSGKVSRRSSSRFGSVFGEIICFLPVRQRSGEPKLCSDLLQIHARRQIVVIFWNPKSSCFDAIIDQIRIPTWEDTDKITRRI